MKRKILFSGAGGSMFPYLFKKLEDKYDVYAMDSNREIGKVYSDYNVLHVGNVKSKEFESQVYNLIEKFKIDFYIPLIDEEIIPAHKIASKFKSLKVIAPCIEFSELCLNKFRLMEKLKQENISNIKTCLAHQTIDFEYPLFLKPVFGRGSRGIQVVMNDKELDAYKILAGYRDDEILVQECLRGIEYTVSVVVNSQNEKLAIVPKRIITKRGITQHAVTEHHTIIEEKCEEIINKLKPHGSFNVQLMLEKDQVKIFEINPRFSTTSILTCEAGVNEFDLCIENYEKSQGLNYSFKEGLNIYRTWESRFY